MRFVLVVPLLLLLAVPARAQERLTLLPYKDGDSFPGRNFNGVDFLEPFFPVAAARRGDAGRIVLDTAVPYAFLASSFAVDRGTDLAVSKEIARWKGIKVDRSTDTYAVLFAYVAVSFASILLPAPEDELGYSWDLRLDRVVVYALGHFLTSGLRELLVPLYDVPRPDGSHYTSQNDARPSGHVGSAFACGVFLSHMLRDWLQPQRETNALVRLGEELLVALPYLPPIYVLLERVKTGKHTLVDGLIGAAIGIFSMNLFYSWSYERRELGLGWVEGLDFSYDPERRGFLLAVSGRF